MKKNPKFYFFGSIHASRLTVILLYPAAALLLLAFLFIFSSPSSSLAAAKGALGSALRTFSAPGDEKVARAMLQMSLPALSFSKNTKTKGDKEASSPSEAAPTEPPKMEEATALPPPPQNNAYSVTYNKAEEKGYRSAEGIYVNNQTNKTFDIASLLNSPLDLTASDGPIVLIVHTHTSESYTPSAAYNYVPSDTDRTEDLNYNMASVGEAVAEKLTQANINFIHDKSINDYPSYSGSYSKTLKLIESYIQKYPSIKVVLDVHRDAIIRSDGTKVRTAVNIAGTDAAQVMFVVGTDQSGLAHPNWKNNLAFAVRLQQKMNALYPSLARPINLRKQRFNQHMTNASLIVEVGTNGNTLDEAKYGASLFADALIKVLEEG